MAGAADNDDGRSPKLSRVGWDARWSLAPGPAPAGPSPALSGKGIGNRNLRLSQVAMFHMIPVAALGMMVQGPKRQPRGSTHPACSAVVHRAQEVKRRRPVDDPLRRRLEISLRVNAALAPTVDAAVAADKTIRAGLDGRTAAAMASVTAMTDQALAEGLVACAKYVGSFHCARAVPEHA